MAGSTYVACLGRRLNPSTAGCCSARLRDSGAATAMSQRLRPNLKYATGPTKFTKQSATHIALLPRS